MATTTDGVSVYTNIADLPEIEEIQAGSLLIVETPEGTSIIDFANFVIGPENTTFGDTITENTTNIDTLSASNITNVLSISSNTTSIASLSSAIDSNTSDIVVNTSDITALSASLVITNSNFDDKINKQMTVGYYLAGNLVGPSFIGTEQPLGINYIQSNTIDGNFENGNSTLCGITSGSNTINLNQGTYAFTIVANISGLGSAGAVIDLYDASTSRVIMTSDSCRQPTIGGIVSLPARTNLQIRGYAVSTKYVGGYVDVVVTDMVRTPLLATFTYLSSGVAQFNRPDIRG